MSADESICESSLPPNKSSEDIGERLPQLPDDHADFTPELALEICGLYREIISNQSAEIERLRRERDEALETVKDVSDRMMVQARRALTAESAESAVAAAQGAMSKFLAAWNSLPEGDYPPSIVGKWLNGDAMKEGLSAIRAAVSKKTAESGHSPSTLERD